MLEKKLILFLHSPDIRINWIKQQMQPCCFCCRPLREEHPCDCVVRNSHRTAMERGNMLRLKKTAAENHTANIVLLYKLVILSAALLPHFRNHINHFITLLWVAPCWKKTFRIEKIPQLQIKMQPVQQRRTRNRTRWLKGQWHCQCPCLVKLQDSKSFSPVKYF